MKYLLLLVFFFFSCYAPNKAIYEFKYVRLIDIHKTELGYDLMWKDSMKLYYQFVKDTSGTDIYLGMTVLTLLPK